MSKVDSGTSSRETLVIVLSTVFGVIGVVLIVAATFWFMHSRRKHRLFNRGITPIGDDEIATWKVNRADEKETERYTRPSHVSKDSTNSARIQYQKGYRPSTDAVISPRSFLNDNYSLDLPRSPEVAVLARAPNARTGLTDETVPGDDPFVPPLRRQPSRLQKMPPNMPKGPSRTNSRTRGSRTNSMKSYAENWQGSAESSPTGSRDANHHIGHSRIYSSSSVPPRLSSSGDNEAYTNLSPPPSRRHDNIGRALG
ncbi:hypothetical protein F5Y19DRAFT_92154 [Xylariaceae sp. FL1651]|nr:hypothetical protein F5Y19DRAFT_92154 [Xylariaceae sp. FL1651]